MGVTFYGNGSVFIPKTHNFVRFVGGTYTTDKAAEIEVLAAQFKHDRHIEVKQPEAHVQISNDDITEPKEQPKKRGRPAK